MLSQRDLREEYDRRGRRPAAPAEAAAPARGPGGAAGAGSRSSATSSRSRRRPERAMAPARGEDVHQVLELTFEEALRGASREGRYQREGACPECRGRRWAPGAKVETCRRAAASGVVEVPHGPWTVHRICPTCAGEGETGTPPAGPAAARAASRCSNSGPCGSRAGSASGSRIVVAGGRTAGAARRRVRRPGGHLQGPGAPGARAQGAQSLLHGAREPRRRRCSAAPCRSRR